MIGILNCWWTCESSKNLPWLCNLSFIEILDTNCRYSKQAMPMLSQSQFSGVASSLFFFTCFRCPRFPVNCYCGYWQQQLLNFINYKLSSLTGIKFVRKINWSLSTVHQLMLMSPCSILNPNPNQLHILLQPNPDQLCIIPIALTLGGNTCYIPVM